MKAAAVRGGSRVLDSGIVAVVSDDPAVDIVNPLFAPVRAIDVKTAAFDVWMMAKTKVRMRLGVEFSNNPIDFTGASRKEIFASYLATNGWTYGATWYDLFGVTGLVDADYKLYMRIVGLTQTTAASTLAEGAQVRVRMRMKPVRAATFAGPMARVNTAGRCGAMILTLLLLGCKADCVHPLAELCARSPEACLPLPPPEELPDDVVVEGCDGYLRVTQTGKDSVGFSLYDATSRRLLGRRTWSSATPPSCGWQVWGATIDCDPVWISGGTGGVTATGGTGAGVAHTADTGRP